MLHGGSLLAGPCAQVEDGQGLHALVHPQSGDFRDAVLVFFFFALRFCLALLFFFALRLLLNVVDDVLLAGPLLWLLGQHMQNVPGPSRLLQVCEHRLLCLLPDALAFALLVHLACVPAQGFNLPLPIADVPLVLQAIQALLLLPLELHACLLGSLLGLPFLLLGG